MKDYKNVWRENFMIEKKHVMKQHEQHMKLIKHGCH